MSHLTGDQQKLVKARKASRVAASLFIFGGACLLLIGIATNYLPHIMNGVVFIASSILPLFVSKMIEKKLNLPSV